MYGQIYCLPITDAANPIPPEQVASVTTQTGHLPSNRFHIGFKREVSQGKHE